MNDTEIKNEEAIIRLNRIIFVLSLIGIIIAVYVTQSFIRKAPIICVNSGCELVRKNPASYLFGFLPVPSVGLIGYSCIALLAFVRTALPIKKSKKLLLAIVGIATFGVLFVSWFTYTELFIIKGICTWCAVSAVNMIVLFIISVKSMLLFRNSN